VNKNALNILSDAISEVGSWHYWLIKDDMIQIQFCDVMFYDETKPQKEPHTTDVLAVRFHGHSFAVFLDNLDDDNWYQRLRDEDSVYYSVDTYELAFDDVKEAASLMNDYMHKSVIKDYSGLETLLTAKHLLYARCGDVGFVAGGDEIRVVGRNRRYSEEDIETASRKWWDYWREYWKLRGTKDAYPEDYACEITIPVREG